jgi:stress-induced morphogen
MSIKSLVLLLTIMFSASVRAFTTAPRAAARVPFARFMSSSEGGTDTSIVDICRQKITDALGTDNVKVQGAFDDPNGSHVSIVVVSDKFEGKRAVQRQQMVYKALWEELSGPLHAVDSMVCKTPEEAS